MATIKSSELLKSVFKKIYNPDTVETDEYENIGAYMFINMHEYDELQYLNEYVSSGILFAMANPGKEIWYFNDYDIHVWMAGEEEDCAKRLLTLLSDDVKRY